MNSARVRSNKPKNERANRKKMAKKAKLAQGIGREVIEGGWAEDHGDHQTKHRIDQEYR